MKHYEKPRLTFLSLSGNDRLCGDCQDRITEAQAKDPGISGTLLQDDPTGAIARAIEMMTGGPTDGVLTKEEVSKVFGPNEDCRNYAIGYCKFASADLNFPLVAWS